MVTVQELSEITDYELKSMRLMGRRYVGRIRAKVPYVPTAPVVAEDVPQPTVQESPYRERTTRALESIAEELKAIRVMMEYRRVGR